MKIPKTELKTVEFTNAGGLPAGLTVKKLISDDYTSSPRNPKIADVFKDVGLIERYGSGIKRIVDACRVHGGVIPEFKDMGTWFKVVLRKVSRGVPEGTMTNGGINGGTNGGINGGIKKVVADNPGIRVSGLSAVVGKSERTVERAVAELKRQGVIEYRGSKKTGGYYLK